MGTDFEGRIQGELEGMVRRGLPGVFVYLADGSGARRFFSAGAADLETGRQMHVGDHYRIGSTTKSFTAVVVLQLIAEGRLALGDRAAGRLPDYGLPHPGALTIEHLLRMRSGLFDFEDDPALVDNLEAHFRGYSADHVVRLALDHPPRFSPGERYEYCNTNYCLLELIIESTTGRSLAEELRQRIFEPLGLAQTSYPAVDDLSLPPPHMRAYERRNGDWQDCTEVFFGRGDGAIVSTAGDVERFFRALLGGRLLPADLLGPMMTIVRDERPGELAYGLGLIADPLPGRTAWGHAGGGYGFAHAPYLDLGSGRFVLCMRNGSYGFHGEGAEREEAPRFRPDFRDWLYTARLE